MLSIPLEKYLEAELLQHMVVPGLQLWQATTLGPTAAALFYIPTSNAQGFRFFSIFPNISVFSGPWQSYTKECEAAQNHFCTRSLREHCSIFHSGIKWDIIQMSIRNV